MRVFSPSKIYLYSRLKVASMMSNNRFLLLYGSQTGQAQAIAEEIHQYANNHGLEADIHCLSQTEKKFNIVDEKLAVIVVSTTGDGDPPDTAVKFWRRLKKKTLPDDHLKHLKFTVLGLGDSNYTSFCKNGKNFDKRFEQLGGTRFYPSGFADDGVGLEIVVEPWIEGLWAALRKELNLDCQQTNTNSNPQTDTVSTDFQNLQIQNSKIIPSELTNGDLTEKDSSSSQISDFKIAESDEGRTGSEPTNKHTDTTKASSSNDIEENLTNQNAVTKNITANDISSTKTLSNSSANNSNASTKETATNEILQNKGEHDREQPISMTVSNDKVSGASDIEPEPIKSLISSCPPLSESSLTLPPLPPVYLTISYHPEQTVDLSKLPLHGGVAFPSATSPVVMATVQSAQRLTRNDAVKTCLKIELDISNTGIEYNPGDSIGVVCQNNTDEVNFLINRLSIQDKVDIPMTVQLLENTKKKRAQIPEFVPKNCTLRHALLMTFDLRTPPKKAFIRLLAEYTNTESEKRRLKELCSRQGSEDYEQFIRFESISIIDLLVAFPSCNPPIERMLEMLPRLQARPYSVSSSPLVDPGKLEFAFNIIEIPHGNSRHDNRQGVCTGWMSKLSNHLHNNESSQEDIQMPIFARTNTSFRLPDDVTKPLILIGPGTGVAPFIGFLQHRYHQRQQQESIKFGETWLFFGCRHRNRDYIFRDTIEEFESNGTLSKLCVSFSRDGEVNAPCYVQDSMKLHQDDLGKLVLERNAIIYVCGDAKNMARDVNNAWTEIIAKYINGSEEEAKTVLRKMRDEKQYLEDIWT